MREAAAIIMSIIMTTFFSACSDTLKASDNIPSADSTTVSFESKNSEAEKTLVVYFSASGNTERAAELIAKETHADIFEIIPKEEYTSADLNWTDDNSRVVYEYEHTDARDVELESVSVENWESYDTVFIGYPIWWQIAAWPTDSFVKANDFTGKTVIPFCTSTSSGLGKSGELLAKEAGTGNWLEGKRFSGSVSEDDIRSWIGSLGITFAVPSETSSKGGKTLIAYFSWSGNTTEMANTIAEKTGGELFEIVPVTPYPEEYTPCTEVALEERDSNARPEIKDLPASIEEYDTILIGYPIWWHTAPMIIGTFLENYDLTGIEVYPFAQSASMDEDQFENSMEFVRDCAGNGSVHDGLFADSSDEAAIEEYLKNNGLTD